MLGRTLYLCRAYNMATSIKIKFRDLHDHPLVAGRPLWIRPEWEYCALNGQVGNVDATYGCA